ncbi:MAG: / family [Verrucomicrobiota bacterium]|jgi:hypothetical protein
MKDLLQKIKQDHACQAPASKANLAALRKKLAFDLPADLVTLLSFSNGIEFFPTTADAEGECVYRLLPAAEMDLASSLLHADEEMPSLLAILTIGDVGFVGIGIDPELPTYGKLIDCDHETFPFELFGICDSIEELLKLILASKGDEWTGAAALKYNVDFAEAE